MVPQRRRVDPTATRASPHIELRRSREDMTDPSPVDEVLAGVDRNTREVLERGGDEEVVGPDADDAGVRIEAGENGVAEGHDGQRAM